MKYIYKREQFLKINEEAGPMTNDINWGDSFLGRFINSVWRRGVIQKRSSVDIPRILNDIKLELNKIKASSEYQDEIYLLKVFNVINNLGNFIIKNSDNIKSIISESTNSIEELKSISFNNKEYENIKKDLINGLYEFVDFLKKQLKDDDVSDDVSHNISKNIKEIFNKIKKNNNYFLSGNQKIQIYTYSPINNPNKILDHSGEKAMFDNLDINDSNDIDNIVRIINTQIDNIRTSIKNGNFAFSDHFKNKLKNYFNTGTKKPTFKKIYGFISFDKHKNVLELKKLDDNKTYIIDIFDYLKTGTFKEEELIKLGESLVIPSLRPNINPSDFPTYIHMNGVDQQTKYILEEFNKLVEPQRVFYTKDQIKELEEKVENSGPEEITHQSIINLVRLFNRAYKTYTTEKIPSGRTGGQVSVKTELEYDKIGGKFRNKKLFNKFEDGVLKIIGDPVYSNLFTDKIPVAKKGTGKMLLEFINSLLDANKLYSSGAQASLLAKYFGLNINDYKTSDESSKKDNDDKKDDNKPKQEDIKESTFTQIQGKVGFNPNTLYYVLGDKEEKIFIYIIQNIDDSYKIVKISDHFSSFKPYFNNYKYNQNFNIDTDTQKGENDISLGIIKVVPDKSIIDGKFINIGKYLTKTNTTINPVNIKIDKVYRLSSEEGKSAKSDKEFDTKRIQDDLNVNLQKGLDLIGIIKKQLGI